MILTWEQLKTLLNTAKVLKSGNEQYSFSEVSHG